MAKVRNREDALLDAYLGRYKSAQASTVSEGQSKTKSAQQKGSALLNATDKTLPALKNTYSDTLQNIVSGASIKNNLNNDVMQRSMNLAKAKFDAANDLYEQQKKAQQYAEKQAEKEAAAAAKAAAKAARSGRSSGKSKSKSGSSTGSAESSEDAGAAMDALFGSTASTGGSTASSKPKAGDTKKDETKNEKPKEKSAQEKYLEAKKAGARTTVAKSYAEQNGTGRVSAAQPAQSRAVTKGGKVIASSYAAAGSAPSAAEAKAATKRKQQTADALKKLQTDSSYRAELAAPGRKLTSAEVQAVNQYNQNANDLLKQVNNGTLSWDDYNTQAQALSKLNQKASLGGWGQDLQAFTAGLMRSFPLQKQTEKVFTDWADKQTGGKYTQAVESGALPAVVPTLDKYTEQDQLAAMAGSMAGKMAQYKYFNQLMAGTPYAAVAEKAGGKLYDAAKKIPVLQNIVQPGFGEAAGRVLADTGADLALDTLPTLADDLSTYSSQQQAIANGQTVDDALTPGKIAGNTAKNIAGNVAMNALPEIGGAVVNGIKNSRAAMAADAANAQQALSKQAKTLEDEALQKNAAAFLPREDATQKPAAPRDIQQPEATGTTGLVKALQGANRPDNTNRVAIDRLSELNSELDLNVAKERELQRLREEVMKRAKEISDEAVNSANTVSAFDVYRDSYIPELQRNLQDTATAQRANAYADLQNRLATAATQSEIDDAMLAYDSALENLPTMGNQAQVGNIDGWQETPDIFLRRPVDETAQTAYDPWGNSYNPNVLNRVDNVPAADVQSVPALERQTAQSVSEAVPTLEQRPLNGSESVPENAVGAQSTQYDRREVVNQDYANQRAMGGKIDADEAAAAGIGQQTHTVYSRAEGKDTAKQDFDLLVQQNGDILSAGRTVADELARKSAEGNFDASDVYRGYYAADQLQNMLNSYEKGSADAQLVQAQIENLNRAVSAGQSKNAQALSAGRWAQIDEYTPIRKFEQITQRKVNDFAKTRDGKQLESLATDVVEMAKSGPQDEEFTAFLKAQGVDVGDNPLNAQMDDLAVRIKKMADAKGVKATDEQAKSAAASILAGGNADDVFNAMARKSLGIENLSQEDYDYVKNAFAEMADMPDSKARYEKELDAYKRLTKYMPAKTFGDKMESIRYLSMLGNTRTHARNVLGNVSMGVVTRAKDNVSGVMQLALPKDQRTKAVGTTLTVDGRKMVDLAKEYGQNKMYSVLYNDGKFNAESGLRAAQDTFTSKPGKVIQKAADINSALLEKEDNIFLTSAFGNAMASQLKARGYDSSVFTATDAKSKQALVDAAATALRDAKEATFHEDNFLSTALKNFQNDIKGHRVGGKILWAVGEGVLPFKKTPLNIAKNAMEYNIVGGTVEAAYRYATGASNADVIDAAAKGLTGTALMGIGGILAYNGLLNGSKSGDDRADAFDEMTGKQEYSINIPGKGTYTIDWASPASVPLLMGAEIANEWQNGGLSVTKFLDAARKIGNPILDTTMLQGLNDTLDSVSYADSDDKLATLLMGTMGSYAQQYVPTAFGQIARTIDPLRRSTYGGGNSKTERDTNYAIRKAENKIPGLSMNNEPYIDQWGREEASLDGADDTAGGMFLRGVYNFGSPGYYSAENVTPVDEYLQGLYGSTNDSHVLPEKASSQIKVDGEGYYMTPKEKTEYAKTSGQTAYDIVDSLRQNDMFLQLPEDQQSALVQDAYSVAKTAGGVAAVGDGVSGTESKEYEAYKDGGVDGLVGFMLMKNATDLVRDEKRETSGNDSAKLTDVETWNTLYSQFGDDAVDNFVNSTKEDSTVRNISDLAGDKAVTAYMQAYSAVAKTLDDGQTPDKFTVGYGMQKYGLSGDDFARAYLAAYYKKDKNGKYPEKGGSYADKAGAEIYQSYGANALQDWVNYRATIPDTNGNGKADKDEAVARLKEMDLTNEMRRAYLAKTNKQWDKKNPF